LTRHSIAGRDTKEVIAMKSLSSRLLFWAPRLLLAALWASYVILFVPLIDLNSWSFGWAAFQVVVAGLLLCGLALGIEAVTQEYRAGTMRRSVWRLLFWTPRIIVLLFAAMLAPLALDVLSEGYGFWETLGALLIRLIPTWILLGVLIGFWRHEQVAAICYVTVAMWLLSIGNQWQDTLWLAGLPLLVGVLFLLNWLYRAELRPGSYAAGAS